jgi:hypothetical protein
MVNNRRLLFLVPIALLIAGAAFIILYPKNSLLKLTQIPPSNYPPIAQTNNQGNTSLAASVTIGIKSTTPEDLGVILTTKDNRALSGFQIFLNATYQQNTPPEVTVEPTLTNLSYLLKNAQVAPDTKSVKISIAAFTTSGFIPSALSPVARIHSSTGELSNITIDPATTKIVALDTGEPLPIDPSSNKITIQ